MSSPLTEVRPNVGGSKRAFRVAVLFLVALAALYAGFAVYDRTAPGGSGSPATNGLWLFTAVFAVFAIVGIVYSLTPAPRFVEVATSRLTVVGRWGRRRRLPPMERLSIRVVRRYAPGFLSDRYVELVEVWGTDTPVRSYLVEEGIFSGAKPVDR
ncbi:MAG TPA: hypothetical protein VEG42_05275 [Thermoplasmata archaeon]|nr:hypothetical protein [Thermoplasmata archaeon]